MTIESLITTIASLWHIPPVRWAVYLTIALYVLYVYTMRYKRIRDRRVAVESSFEGPEK